MEIKPPKIENNEVVFYRTNVRTEIEYQLEKARENVAMLLVGFFIVLFYVAVNII